MVFGDDDDGVEPEFRAVDEYRFEVRKDQDVKKARDVCFSVLPFHFDENDKVQDCGSEKKVYLRGAVDKHYLVLKKVVAWRVELDSEQPNISVCLSEGKWIRLLEPWKPYKQDIARSILITVQMLHFVRRQHRDKRSLWSRLWDHLDEVFNKLDAKPTIDDLRKHQPLIKLFLKGDSVLMNNKILRMLIRDTTNAIKEITGNKVKCIGNDEPHAVNNDDHGHYDDDEDNNVGHFNQNEDDIKDNDIYTKIVSDDDDDNTNNVDGTDALCCLCDDGGALLSCTGVCQRSFHPRKKDGRESKCKTLGYTPAKLKAIDTFLCKNCEHKQHQCFICGVLEPSGKPNAKVFKCMEKSCGHFYHPKCVAKLLEPNEVYDDGTCELAKRIMEGMPFKCPAHWCFQCGNMEDKTNRALQFAVCRRCPKSYHRECLPRNISFETTEMHAKRAWELSNIVIIYCLDHELCEATGNATRDHIKFPPIKKSSKVRDLAKEGKWIGKRKRNNDQCSTKSTEVLDRLHTEKNKHTQRVVVDNSLDHLLLEPECSAMCMKEDLQSKPSIVGATGQGGQKVRGQKKQFGTSSSSVLGIRTPSSAAGSKIEKRKTGRREKKISVGTSRNFARKCGVSSEGLLDSVQDILLENPPVNKDAEVDEVCRIPEDRDGNMKKEPSEHSEKGDAANKDILHESNEQIDVLDKLFADKCAEGDQSELTSRKERSNEREKMQMDMTQYQHKRNRSPWERTKFVERRMNMI